MRRRGAYGWRRREVVRDRERRGEGRVGEGVWVEEGFDKGDNREGSPGGGGGG